MTFTNAFAPDRLPARATILTGMYPRNTGVFDHTFRDGGYNTFVSGGAEEKTLAVRTQAAGYRTAFAGKYLNGYEVAASAVPPGWDESFGLAGTFADGYGYEANHNGVMESFGTDPADYQTDVLAEKRHRSSPRPKPRMINRSCCFWRRRAAQPDPTSTATPAESLRGAATADLAQLQRARRFRQADLAPRRRSAPHGSRDQP